MSAAFNVLWIGAFGIDGPFAPGGVEDPGPYPENGTSEEQREWNQSKDEYDWVTKYDEMMQKYEDSGMITISIIFSLLTFFIGIPAAILAWANHEKMLHIAIPWALLKMIGDIWVSFISTSITVEFMESIPGGGDYTWIAYSSIGGTATCGLCMLGLIVTVALVYRPGPEIPESAFHINNQIQEEE